jgi:hypothetical protein
MVYNEQVGVFPVVEFFSYENWRNYFFCEKEEGYCPPTAPLPELINNVQIAEENVSCRRFLRVRRCPNLLLQSVLEL